LINEASKVICTEHFFSGFLFRVLDVRMFFRYSFFSTSLRRNSLSVSIRSVSSCIHILLYNCHDVFFTLYVLNFAQYPITVAPPHEIGISMIVDNCQWLYGPVSIVAYIISERVRWADHASCASITSHRDILAHSSRSLCQAMIMTRPPKSHHNQGFYSIQQSRSDVDPYSQKNSRYRWRTDWIGISSEYDRAREIRARLAI
jgi:hypothetical protein